MPALFTLRPMPRAILSMSLIFILTSSQSLFRSKLFEKQCRPRTIMYARVFLLLAAPDALPKRLITYFLQNPVLRFLYSPTRPANNVN